MFDLFSTIFTAIGNIILSGRKPVGTNDNPAAYVPPTKSDVDILIDKQIRNKYQQGWIGKKRGKAVTEIVIHGTQGGTSIEGLLSWMYGGERAKEYNQGIALFHYGIGQDGKIVEVIDPEYWVYHSSSGAHDKTTIGIELMNPDKANMQPYTEAQYKALFGLIFDHLLPLYPSIKRIVSHNYNQKTYSGWGKQCPGQGFDWSKVTAELQARKMPHTSTGEVYVLA